MAKIKVKYKVYFEETIDWPDDEIDNLNYESLVLNTDYESATQVDEPEIFEIEKDGKDFSF